jgi:hypothetical protein
MSDYAERAEDASHNVTDSALAPISKKRKLKESKYRSTGDMLFGS